MINVMTKARVLSKWSKDVVKDDGSTTTYYSVKLADPVKCENDVCNVSEEVYNKVQEGSDVCLYGYVARFGKNTSLKFTQFFDSKEHFKW